MGSKITNVLKFLFFVLLLPFVITSTQAFGTQLGELPGRLTEYFMNGILAYLLVHIFIYEPQPIYQYGQNLVSSVFKFFSPFVRIAPFVLPIFSFIFLILFYLASLIFKSQEIQNVLMFFVSFTLAMHMVFTAKAMRDRDTNAAKPNYFFAVSLIYSVNIFMLALAFHLILKDFSFPDFFQSATQETERIYKTVFNQLFVAK